MNESDRSPDTRVFFPIGLALITIAIATDNIAFLGAGVVFMIIGLKGLREEKK